jgi:four helix bundle protein
MGDYRSLSVWQKAMNLSEKIYRATANYPAIEKYGLADQMRRASVSIASNIAEGYGRGTDNEFIHFLSFSKGSSNELETQIELSYRFGYVNDEAYNTLLYYNSEVNKMLASLIYRRKNKMDSFERPE